MAFWQGVLDRLRGASSLQLSLPTVPPHIAIIMDGNGRWAEERGIPTAMGHRAGWKALRRAVVACSDLKVNYLTVYAFSTENWGRPQEEVHELMNLIGEVVDNELPSLNERNVHLSVLGRMNDFAPKVRSKIELAVQTLSKNTGLHLNIMLNYGGRAEMVDAVNGIVEDVKGGRIARFPIDEQVISDHLYTHGMPDPDLLIRTGGEMRVSNFLLWQIAYSEIWMTPLYWPDFNQEHLIEAIDSYARRQRRFGKRSL